jgi:thiol-disulfide isomerase/thioredoxin
MSFLKLGGAGNNNFMTTLKNYTSSISTKTIVIILVVILFLGIGIYYYNTHVKSKKKTSYSANNEHTFGGKDGKTGGGQAEIMLFYADWCPHCKTAKPIWEEMKAEYENKTINGYTVLFTDVNCTTETPEVEKLMTTYKIEGFPTIKLLKDGQVIEFDAKPSKATLEQFLNTVL